MTYGDRIKPSTRYDVDLRRVSPMLSETFVELSKDEETSSWLHDKLHPSCWRGCISEVLRCCCSRTTANGVAGRGEMFVLSCKQAEKLLFLDADEVGHHVQKEFNGIDTDHDDAGGKKMGRSNSSRPCCSLLDVGAGDGHVTKRLAPFFYQVDATEDSIAMRFRLWQKGIRVLEEDLSAPRLRDSYDVVSCLNVLDRADRPQQLLMSLRSVAKDNGLILLAVVLPFCPTVEVGPRHAPPSEMLSMAGGLCTERATFEASLTTLVHGVLEPAGFEVLRWSRVPYYCEGSPSHEYYALDEAVLVLKKKR